MCPSREEPGEKAEDGRCQGNPVGHEDGQEQGGRLERDVRGRIGKKKGIKLEMQGKGVDKVMSGLLVLELGVRNRDSGRGDEEFYSILVSLWCCWGIRVGVRKEQWMSTREVLHGGMSLKPRAGTAWCRELLEGQKQIAALGRTSFGGLEGRGCEEGTRENKTDVTPQNTHSVVTTVI